VRADDARQYMMNNNEIYAPARFLARFLLLRKVGSNVSGDGIPERTYV